MRCPASLQVLLRFGIVTSRQAPTDLHPYGYLKDKFLWSLVSAVGIFCLGSGVTVAHGVMTLGAPPAEISHLGYNAAGGAHALPVAAPIMRVMHAEPVRS